MNRVREQLRSAEFVPEELEQLDFDLSSQYLCNFSIFQSAADTWAIDQVLPVVPLTRMNEVPDVNCSLVDITCDSDGKIDQFTVGREISNVIYASVAQRRELLYWLIFDRRVSRRDGRYAQLVWAVE